MGASNSLRASLIAFLFLGFLGSVTGCRFIKVNVEQPAIPSRAASLSIRIAAEEFDDNPLAEANTFLALNDTTLLIGDQDRLHTLDTRSGERLASFGRTGKGPGEFGYIGWTSLLNGDTVVVFDAEQDRFTFIAAPFKVSRTSSYPHMTDSLEINPVCALKTGEIVAVAERIGGPRRPDGLQERFGLLRIYSADVKRHRHLDTLRFSPLWVGVTRTNRGPIRTANRIPFAPTTSIRCSQTTVYWGDGTESLVLQHVNGKTTPVPVPGLTAEPITRKLRNSFLDSAVANRPVESLRWFGMDEDAYRDRIGELMDLRPYESLPYFQDVRIGTDGSLWLLVPRLTADWAKSWVGFDESGASLGTVRVPTRFVLRAVTRDKFWGVVLDANDVPEVRSYSR